MLEEIKSEVDPLSSENKLIFATGSASDTKIPGSAKYGVKFAA
ncbi:hypothetical protein HKBW3S03_01180 [Candidatus Hakubella thermalkaliphila]|uniref:Aldehyde ferredoxin oxidoreductase N-terminal domain-containing protein n=2 Tax=Candidatus Hakubella thermalkaliphila TaxID=2754717 RepID=A0A6V8NHF1_9ACTN|nr:hypothetical protein HKBW3S03_01180 [Candidatus Hakubella thermalkaliphila]